MTHKHRQMPTRAHSRKAFTLAEALIAVSITAIIGAAVSAMIYAVSYGTSSKQDLRSLVTQREIGVARVTSALRACKMVLAEGDGYAVVWSRDSNCDQTPSLSELCRIELNPRDGTIYSYQAPASPGQDVICPLESTDFAQVTSQLKGSASFPGTPMAEGVNKLSFSTAGGECQGATYVGYTIGFSANGATSSAVGGVALLNHR